MPNFTIRWTNRSQSDQDWLISNGDDFQLKPQFVRNVAITINNNYTWQISVSTHGGTAAASLSYVAATQAWTLNTLTPREWQLASGGGLVTVRCCLEDVSEEPEYAPGEPVRDNQEGTGVSASRAASRSSR